jgi:hypothetical protein
MKDNHPHILLWDDMETSQVPVTTQDDHHLVNARCQAAISTSRADKVALMVFLLFLSLEP